MEDRKLNAAEEQLQKAKECASAEVNDEALDEVSGGSAIVLNWVNGKVNPSNK